MHVAWAPVNVKSGGRSLTAYELYRTVSTSNDITKLASIKETSFTDRKLSKGQKAQYMLKIAFSDDPGSNLRTRSYSQRSNEVSIQ